jgi:hypothetical protein
MIKEGEDSCPVCGGKLKRYDKVKRLIKTEYGHKKWIDVERFVCTECHRMHRVIPNDILPYKQYEKHIIEGFINNTLDSYRLEYEDFPSESIINEWKRTQKLHPFL